MRKVVTAVLLAACAGSFHVGAQTSAKQQELEALLSRAGPWTFLWEQTDQLLPSAAASKGTMEFFRREGKLFGRTTHMISGNCEFPALVRDDGFIFEWCGGYQNPQSSVSFDSGDPKFPFKNVAAPRKVWFQPK